MRNRFFAICLSLALLFLIGAGLSAQQPSRAEAELQARIEKAQALQKQGKVDEALAEYRQVITLAARVYGAPGDLRIVPLLQRLAVLYQVREKYSAAESLYKRAVDIRQAKLPEDHSDLAESLDLLGDFYRRRGQLEQAEPLYQKALQIYKARKEAVSSARSLRRLAGLASDHGDLAQAERLARQSLQLLQGQPKPNHAELARAINNLAAVSRARGDYQRARQLLDNALQLRQEKLGKESLPVAESFNNLGELAQLTGHYEQAESFYRSALEILEARLGPRDPACAKTLGNLGLLCLARGDLTGAEPLLERSLKLLRDRFGPEHSEVAQGLNNLALLRRATGQYDQAEELYKESLRIRKARLGAEHLEVAASLNNLANLQKTRHRFQQAESLYRECLTIREARLGQGHLLVAETANNLGILDTALGRHEEAERLLRRALEVRKTRLGTTHPEVAQTLGELAMLARARGQQEQAEKLSRQSLQVFEAALPPDHPNLALARGNLALLQAGVGRWQQAGQAIDTARHILRRHIHRVLPGLSEQEQLLFLDTQHRTSFDTSLSLGLAQPKDETLAALSAGWVLNGKGVIQQALAERALLARDSQDRLAANAAKQLSAIRTQLAALSLRTPASGQETAHRQELARLTAQEERLSKQLGRVRLRRGQADPWVELEEVRRAVPGDGVLIELARVRQRDFAAAGAQAVWKSERYVAWVIPAAGKGTVRLLDLGPAAVIDAAVLAVHRELQDAPSTISSNEAASERRLRTVLAETARLVLRPLEAEVGDVRRWLLSPDGSLWLLPWAALPLADGSFALEKHSISYLVSGRDLLMDAGKEKPGPALILADPDYDLKPAGAFSPTRSGDGVPLLGKAERLPGTAAEARAIAPRLKAYTGIAPRVFLGKEAQEAVFKKANSPRVVLLATHGFFLDEADVLRNPLLRCGLLLAGANQRGHVAEEDGILTGLEIVGADLRGTELVVLSACETALGQVRSGEGVAGLRQAFQLAGARSVVATLWSIPDSETVPLMTAFFDGLTRGANKADALRSAQLKLLASRREKKGSTHPFFWAAFTLTGE